MAQRASKDVYLGVAVFGSAAVPATIAALWYVGFLGFFTSNLSGWVTVFVYCLAAALSTVFSFTLFDWFDWRLSRGPLLLRALSFAPLVVVVSHLVFGFFYVPLALLLTVDASDVEWREAFEMAFLFGYDTILYSIEITLPFGIAAAVLFEVLKRRRMQASGDHVEAVG
jgi:hypothetical protein